MDNPVIVAGHGGYAVTWSMKRGVYVMLLDRQGVPTTKPVLVTQDSFAPADIAASDDGFGVVWDDWNRGVFFRRVSKGGELASPIVRVFDRRAWSSRIAFGGGRYTIAWETGPVGDDAAFVDVAALRSDGTVAVSPVMVDGDGVVIPTGHLAIAHAGDEVAITWSYCRPQPDRGHRCLEDAELALLRLHPDRRPQRTVVVHDPRGHEIGSTSVVRAAGAWAIAYGQDETVHVVMRGQDTAVAPGHRAELEWTGRSFGIGIPPHERDVEWRQLDAAGRPTGRTTRVNDVAGAAAFAHMTWAGDHYAFVWIDRRSGTPALYFARVSADGAPLGTPTPLR